MAKKYTFGLIGCGRISRNHLEAIAAAPDASLQAVCDIDHVALKAAETKYNCQGYSDYKVMLADPKLEIVNICIPSGLHAQMAVAAMRAGKHVIVEKPMAMSLYEADTMIKAAAENGVKMGVVHKNRFNKPVMKLRSELEDGKFGRLTHGSATVRWNRDENYYRQASWRGTMANDGGCLMNQSIHIIDLLQWMLGEVREVFAYTATNLRKIEGEDIGAAVLKFANGALATIEAATTIYPQNLEVSIGVFGSTGTVVIAGVAANKKDLVDCRRGRGGSTAGTGFRTD